jgi:hypothetical protein
LITLEVSYEQSEERELREDRIEAKSKNEIRKQRRRRHTSTG